MTKHMASKWFRSKQFCIAEITAVYALLNHINSVLNCLGKGLGNIGLKRPGSSTACRNDFY